MRRYETIIVIDPDLLDDNRQSFITKIEEIISDYKGTIIEIDKWGLKKLAYEVKRKGRGFYVRFDYCGNPELVTEIERILRIDDRTMKYITVLLKKNVDVEKLQQEIASSKAQQENEENEQADFDNFSDGADYNADIDDNNEKKEEAENE